MHVNPTGRFVLGGPMGDAGLTGRKIIVDTYGGMARHGGGAFSGKDPTKVDRSAAYAARWVAKNVVAAGLADRFEVELAYGIGIARPVSISVESFGTGVIPDTEIQRLIEQHFDLRPGGIIDALDLLRPIYRQTAAYGHFGRVDLDLPWEHIDKAQRLADDAGVVMPHRLTPRPCVWRCARCPGGSGRRRVRWSMRGWPRAGTPARACQPQFGNGSHGCRVDGGAPRAPLTSEKTFPIVGPSSVSTAMTTTAMRTRMSAYSTSPWPRSSPPRIKSMLVKSAHNRPRCHAPFHSVIPTERLGDVVSQVAASLVPPRGDVSCTALHHCSRKHQLTPRRGADRRTNLSLARARRHGLLGHAKVALDGALHVQLGAELHARFHRGPGAARPSAR